MDFFKNLRQEQMFQKSINSQQARVGLNPNLWHRLKYLIQIKGRTPPSLFMEIQQLLIFEIHPVEVIKSQLAEKILR